MDNKFKRNVVKKLQSLFYKGNTFAYYFLGGIFFSIKEGKKGRQGEGEREAEENEREREREE